MNGSDKRRLHHTWTRLRRIKPWYFLVLAAISAVICVFALRANNLHMIELRQAVYQADKDNGDIEGSLRALREQVYGHMNTSLAAGPNAVHPPIQLQYTYQRLLDAKKAGAAATASSNEDIYSQAQQYCEKAIPSTSGVSGRYRLSCIQSFVKQRSLGTTAEADISVPKNLYQFDFVAAKWSPDLAGWSMVATFVLLVLAAGSFAWQLVVRRLVS